MALRSAFTPRKVHAVLLCFVAGALVSGAARGQPAPTAEDEPAEGDEVEGEGEGEPETAADGSRYVQWKLHPNVSLRLMDQNELDRDLQAWPGNLVAGRRSTAMLAMLEHRVGPLTLFAGGGLGITTTTQAPTPAGIPARERQRPAAVGTAGVKLELPERWTLRAGVTAIGSDDSEIVVGVSAEKKF